MRNPLATFAETFCSQCGGAFGPGDSGYSHCDQHRRPRNTMGTTTHKVRAEYPLAGSDDGIEVDIEFTYRRGRPAVMYLRNGDPGYPAEPEEIEFEDFELAMTTWRLPEVIMKAIEYWARDWLESDEGHSAAASAAHEDLVEARERAMEYRREA